MNILGQSMASQNNRNYKKMNVFLISRILDCLFVVLVRVSDMNSDHSNAQNFNFHFHVYSREISCEGYSPTTKVD